MNINNFTLYYNNRKYPDIIQNKIKQKIKEKETSFNIFFNGKIHHITITSINSTLKKELDSFSRTLLSEAKQPKFVGSADERTLETQSVSNLGKKELDSFSRTLLSEAKQPKFVGSANERTLETQSVSNLGKKELDSFSRTLLSEAKQPKFFGSADERTLFILNAVKNPPPFIMPWGIKMESKLLFIALPISENSQIGREIYERLKLETNIQHTSILSSPHITLFTAYIKKGSDLDILLSNSTNFNRLVKIIKNIFKELFDVENTSSTYQLHSPYNNYKQLNRWVARMYDDNTHNQLSKTRSLQNAFIESVNQVLLGTEIETEMKIPGYIPSDIIGIKPFTFLNSKMAISPYYIGDDWEPHISLTKLDNIEDMNETIEKIKHNSSGQHMGWLNLWKVNTPKFIPTIKKSLNGSLEHIFISYGKFFSYVRL
jgi:hypothetical protein